MTRIFDIDLDVFVMPPAFGRSKAAPRLSPEGYSVPSLSEIDHIIAKWKIAKETPLRLLEHHNEILDAVADLLKADVIRLPICWIHIDAHDDFWGHYSQPPDFHNFMYEVIRRGWASIVVWVYPDGHNQFPAYILDLNRFEVFFEKFRVPIRFETIEGFAPAKGPDFAFLTRSPSFTPPAADAIYDHFKKHTTPA